MSDIPAGQLFYSLLIFPISLFSSLLVYTGYSKMTGQCVRADDVHFGRLIKGQRGLGSKGTNGVCFSKNKTGTPIAFLNSRARVFGPPVTVLKWHLDSSTYSRIVS